MESSFCVTCERLRRFASTSEFNQSFVPRKTCLEVPLSRLPASIKTSLFPRYRNVRGRGTHQTATLANVFIPQLSQDFYVLSRHLNAYWFCNKIFGRKDRVETNTFGIILKITTLAIFRAGGRSGRNRSRRGA